MSLNNPLFRRGPDLYLTDGGLETTMIFRKGIDLPYFAAFDMLKDEKGCSEMKNYYRNYLDIAASYNTGFILESPTWRANPDWIKKVGYRESELYNINKKAIDMMVELKEEYSGKIRSILISGCIGPRGDGYIPAEKMSINEAKEYHLQQIRALSETPVDMISAYTINYVEEAIGITLACEEVGLPCVISFTVETDGFLPSGISMKDAIELIDSSVETKPLYYMINCAHPDHFTNEINAGVDHNWTSRINGIRSNASRKSHRELDNSTMLDRGNPRDLGLQNRELKNNLQHMMVFGGCCGTDEEHVQEIIQHLRYKNDVIL